MKSHDSKLKHLESEINSISLLFRSGNYQEAVNKFRLLEKQYPAIKSLEIYKVGLFIDCGHCLQNTGLIQEAVRVGESNLNGIMPSTARTSLYYNLANGYQSLYEHFERGASIESVPLSENLQRAKNLYREALKIENADFDLKKQLHVNYGNLLDSLGRGLEALYEYDKALKIDPNFAMAIGNKAMTLRTFADISGDYRGAIYAEAYQLLKSLLNKPDQIEHATQSSRKTFEEVMERIESQFKDKTSLSKSLAHKPYDSSSLSDFEKFYIEFCLKYKLFLNLHIQEDNCEAAIHDPIFISLITDIPDYKTFYKLSKHINQIKEDYATARLLLVQSQFKKTEINNLSERTLFVYGLDYSGFNLYYGLLKSAFKECFGIFDKIAGFLNAYLHLGMNDRDVYFHTIWLKGKKIRNEILNSKNISLYALYDIYKDFNTEDYKRIRAIRHALTHRKLVFYDSALADPEKLKDSENIDFGRMLTETISLFQLAKSAIIYLINFVNTEENKKHKDSKGFILPMEVDTTQFL